MTVLPPATSLLPASAGTGKTFRIVDLLLELVVDEGQELGRVVVVTFTDAAAGELRERIRQRLTDAARGLGALGSGSPWHPPDTVLQGWVDSHVRAGTHDRSLQRIRRTLTAFDTATITTMHGFCTRLLTEAAFEAGAPFATERLGDSSRVARDVVADFWHRHTWDASPATLRSFEALTMTPRTLLDLATKAMDPDLLVVPPDPGRPDPVDLSTWRVLIACAQRHISDDALRPLVLESPALVRRKTKSQPVSMPPGRSRNLLFELRQWLDGDPAPAETLPPWVAYFSTSRVISATKDGETPPIHPLFDALQALVDEHATLGPKLLGWRLSLQHEVVRDTRARIAAFLRRRNAVTFDEMLRRVRIPATCPQRGPVLRAAVRHRYDAALVDEFQDTDPDQWAIFRQLFGDRLYLVGDPKQAIYSFRGADFATYQRAAEDCEPLDSLDINYRSDEPLVRAVNRLFCREGMVAPFFTAGIPFVEVSAHRTERGIVDDDRPPLHVRMLGRSGRRLTKGKLSRWQLDSDLPPIVANDIVRQLQRGDHLVTPDGERPIGPGDCAVLTRTNGQARAIAKALLARGVPATTRSDASVLDSPAFDELNCVLRAVHAPLQTALMRRALLTDMMGVSAAELLAMQQDHDDWGVQASRFRAWRALWDERGVLAVTRALLHEGGVATRLLQQGRERRVTDLRHLGELLQRVGAERRLSPTDLLGWMDDGCPGLDEETTRVRQETDAESVQCVTVHSAKGLEYPLVWAPWLHAGSWVAPLDLEQLVIADPAHPGRRRLDLGSPEKADLELQRKNDAIAEDLRLIYVAVTRARHRLVVYYGPSGSDAALGWLLHQHAEMRNDPLRRWSQVDKRTRWKDDQGDGPVVEDLDALAAPGLIAWDPVDWDDARAVVRWDPAKAEPQPLEICALHGTHPPDRAWGRTSFTALTRQVHPHEPHPERDHDADTPASWSTDGELPMSAIPGSAQLGIAVHSVFEHHDFTADAATLRPLVTTTLERHDLPAPWVDPVTEQLQHALQAPLMPGLRLADVPRSQRWDELDFTLPVRDDGSRLRVDAIRRAFRTPLGSGLDDAWPEHLERLDFLPVHGFLVGSIDLVFRWQDRWYLADYKSNRLGDGRADYAPEALRTPMYEALYPLQYHLYVVGLVRLLRSRIPDFDLERDFGGVFYLFVRGMHADHPGHGVFFDRPPTALIQRLDRMLGGHS